VENETGLLPGFFLAGFGKDIFENVSRRRSLCEVNWHCF